MGSYERVDEVPRMRRGRVSAWTADAGALAVLAVILLAVWLLSDTLFTLVTVLLAGVCLVALRSARPARVADTRVEAEAERILSEPLFEELAARELVRARRYERPLAALSVRIVDSSASREPPLDLGTVASVLASFLRQSDLLGRTPDGRLLVLLPETSRHEAAGLITRLQTILPEAKRRLVLGCALFPDEEITWVGLRDRARRTEAPFGEDGSQHDDDASGPAGPAATPRPRSSSRPRSRRAARSFGVVRRVVDVAAVALLIPLLLPVFALVALAIRLDSPGPLLVGHERIGRGGRRFRLLKLRTMVRDAERLKSELSHLNTLPWPDFKIPNDPRVTRVGRWLRLTSLDELPQLYNVLRGDMTLIGPRPCSIPVTRYELWQTQRLEVKPGIFGRWQADGRGRVSFAERCRMDIAQVGNGSLSNDISLVGRTLLALLSGRGAS